MPRRTTSSLTTPERTYLTRLRSDAERLLTMRIDKGMELRGAYIQSDHDMKDAEEAYYAWGDYNVQLLKNLFTTDELVRNYTGISIGFLGGGTPPLLERMSELYGRLDDKTRRLASIRDMLDVIPEQEGFRASGAAQQRAVGEDAQHPTGRKVFVVHGHDRPARDAVANFVRKVGLEPVIVAEEPTEGRTIVEALEHYGKADFAVVLFTPDDRGGTRDATPEQLHPRARQNVVWEHGYFVAALGRRHVCALYKADVELPSDLNGLLYTVMDAEDAWQMKLAREMKRAGLPVTIEALF